MKIAISATNPCHLYDMALALHQRGALGAYHSGYPRWRLRPPEDFPIRAHSSRTLVTYGALRLPRWVRPKPHTLFRWQDRGFDRTVAKALSATDGAVVHALPGQALATFQRAKELGLATVLNHASGPVRQQLAAVEQEYRRIGRDSAAFHAFDNDYFRRADREYALADLHCVASSVVREQLMVEGISADRIWVVPYGANQTLFHPPERSRTDRGSPGIVFAGQLTLRKGLRTLFEAFERLDPARGARLDLYGPVGADMRDDLARVRRSEKVRLHGPVAQAELAEAFRQASVLVLPSLEEAFGLVVPQALNCGLPCIVSNRVGAKDLLQSRVNGSVFPVGDAGVLAQEIGWWLDHPAAFSDAGHGWDSPAEQLLTLTRARLAAS